MSTQWDGIPLKPRNQPWLFIGRTDAEGEAPILWPPDVKSQHIGKDTDAGRAWGQGEKGVTEDEMLGWHHWLSGHAAAASAAKSLQSYPTLCDPRDGSPPGSSILGILQARTLEWVAISFSSTIKWKVKLKSCPTLSDPIDCSPPGSSILGIFQARALEWGAIVFSIIQIKGLLYSWMALS